MLIYSLRNEQPVVASSANLEQVLTDASTECTFDSFLAVFSDRRRNRNAARSCGEGGQEGFVEGQSVVLGLSGILVGVSTTGIICFFLAEEK